MELPHNAYLSSATVEEFIEALKKAPQREIDLAVSRSFFNYDWEIDVASHYQTFYEAMVIEIKGILGEPVFQGSHETFAEWETILPEYVDYLNLTVWKVEGRHFYLRFSWEDKEIPMIVAFGVEGADVSDINHPV